VTTNYVYCVIFFIHYYILCPSFILSFLAVFFALTMFFMCTRRASKPKILARALMDAGKVHDGLQNMYFQAATQDECQAIENDRERYKKILKSKVCTIALNNHGNLLTIPFGCFCYFRTWSTGQGFAFRLDKQLNISLALSTCLKSVTWSSLML
jgi:hypothetical protein